MLYLSKVIASSPKTKHRALKKKYKDKEIGKLVKAEQINTQRKDKLLFEVQLRFRCEQEVTINRDGKELKASLTTALFSILRDKNELKKKNKITNIE